jgi:TonB family protein
MLPTTLMLAHERAHAHGWHSADVLFAELLCTVFWFHPVAHWYRKALRTVHEYLADAAASRQADRKQYGLLLIGQSQSGMPIAFANHFFQSPLKQRLIMLTKKASAPVRAIKFGLVAPLAILFAMLFRQAPAIAQVVDEKHLQFVRDLEAKGWAQTDTVITFDPKTYEETVQIVRNSAAPELDETGKLVYLYAEVQPQFPGGQEAMSKFLMDNIKYPEIAKQKKKEGTVYISFVVDETGNLLHPRAKYYDESSRPLVEEAERVVASMPKWIPAKHKGKTVRCVMNLPVKFTLTQPAAKELFEVDTLPAYPGGLQEMYNFLTKNVKYPEEAKKSGVEGMVVITFLVEGDGTLSNYDFANKSTGRQDFADEVIRVLKIMPNWKSAMKDGKAVRVKYTLPFKFKLSDDK